MIVDRYGNGVHVGERDCSVQRRHQKIVEEAPSPALDDERREALAEGAIRAVVEAGYENVGTLEFLLDRDGNYYFIEINCRIQVEHPVTEMLSGIDIVAEQIRIAAGEPLGYSQHGHQHARPRDRVPHQRRGHRARLPAAGRHDRGATCAPGGPGVRMDSHLYTGLRGAALLRLAAGQAHRVGRGPRRRPSPVRARRSTSWSLEGVVTNIPLHRALLAHPTFLTGEFTTNLLDRVGSARLPGRGRRQPTERSR